MKKSYETIWEIFNKCPNNQMRDVFIDEIETDDTDEFIRRKFQDKNATWEKSELEDGTIIYDINASGILPAVFIHGNISVNKHSITIFADKKDRKKQILGYEQIAKRIARISA